MQATATNDLPDYAQQPPASDAATLPAAAQSTEMAAPDVDDPESNEPVAATTSSPAPRPAFPPSATPATTVPDASAALAPATEATSIGRRRCSGGRLDRARYDDAAPGLRHRVRERRLDLEPVGSACPGAAVASWTVSAPSNGDHAISVATTDTDAVVTVDGAATAKLLSELPDGIAIVGGAGADTFAIASAAVAVTFDGGAGSDTVLGPTADTTWSITGAGAGTPAASPSRTSRR